MPLARHTSAALSFRSGLILALIVMVAAACNAESFAPASCEFIGVAHLVQFRCGEPARQLSQERSDQSVLGFCCHDLITLPPEWGRPSPWAPCGGTAQTRAQPGHRRGLSSNSLSIASRTSSRRVA